MRAAGAYHGSFSFCKAYQSPWLTCLWWWNLCSDDSELLSVFVSDCKANQSLKLSVSGGGTCAVIILGKYSELLSFCM